MMTKRTHPQELSNMTICRGAISSETTSIPVIGFRDADAIAKKGEKLISSSSDTVPKSTIAYSLRASDYRQETHILFDQSTALIVPVWAPEFPHLRVEDAREASEEEAWAAYKEIEPRIRNVLSLLADS